MRSGVKFLLNISGVVVLTIGACPSCRQSDSKEAGSRPHKPQVVVANYPLQYFAQRIGDSEIEVVFPCPNDIDPAFWQPTEEQLGVFKKADLVLLNGAACSKWAEKVALPQDRVVDTCAAFKDKLITVEEVAAHSHGKQAEHSHGGVACTTWIDFQQAVLQATAVRDALQNLVPAKGQAFGKSFRELKVDLLGLDERMQIAGNKLAGKPMLASHLVYQYWARRYNINLQSLPWDADEVPTDQQMERLKEILAKHPAKHMVWEGEPANKAFQNLKALGVGSVTFDPCSNEPEDGDFMRIMRSNVLNMEQVPDGLENPY